MNIVACYKIVYDEQDVVVKPDRTLSFERAALKIGDYDLNAVEAGAQLAVEHDATLIGLTAGGDSVMDSKIRKAILARGPQENVAVRDDALDMAGSLKTAHVLAAAVRNLGDVDLILCGEGSADRYAQQVGIQLGEVLGLPTINGVTSIDLEEGVCARRAWLQALKWRGWRFRCRPFCRLWADMNTPRIPSMKDILNAGKKAFARTIS